MNVLIVSDMYRQAGHASAGDVVHRQAVELARLGIGVQVICPRPRLSRSSTLRGNLAGVIRRGASRVHDGIPVTYLPHWNAPVGALPGITARLLSHALRRHLHARSRDFSFDLLHAHRLFPNGYAAISLAREAGVPLVVSARGSDVHRHPHRNRGIARLTRETLQRAAATVAVSEALAQDIHELGRTAGPVRVVYNGVDLDRFLPVSEAGELRRRLGLPQQGLGILTVSRLIEEKGLRELRQAFEHLATAHPDLWWALVGGGPLDGEMRSWRQRRRLEGRVFLAGPRPHDEIADWLNAAHILVLPSYNEGLPNVVLEAMACARPVVATRVGGIPEAAVDGESAVLVPSRQAQPLVHAIDRLACDADYRERLGRAGLARVRERFGWSRSARDLIAVYREATAGRHPGEREPHTRVAAWT